MNTFRALVVDDEPLAREIVVDLLRRDTDIAGVTETGDPRGVRAILSAERVRSRSAAKEKRLSHPSSPRRTPIAVAYRPAGRSRGRFRVVPALSG